MGSKGSQTTQQQTYSPNPQAVGAISGALGQAQNAAAQPFQQPAAPVAGFSQDQLSAFSGVNGAQGMAQPYIQQAGGLFNQSAQAPNISQFFNPYAGAVTGQLNNIFGQQASQNTGQLTQAAGGVGADRIAVGQSELANQQGLAAGQTMAGLYQPSLGAAQQEQQLQQSAGYGLGALGPAAQNSALQGAQAQLGVGGLQQQLSQAQLNSPYQQRLAQLAYPFQTSQFLAGITGSLAPGLGGTTSGNTTYPGPSTLSQVLGAGTAAAGLYGGFNGGSGGKGGGTTLGGSQNVLNGQGQGVGFDASGGALPGNIMTSARGGRINPYARGGTIDLHRQGDGSYGHFDGGGTVGDPMLRMAELNEMNADSQPGNLGGGMALPDGKPINAGPTSVVPNEQLTPIRPVIPQLPSGGSGSGSSGGSGGPSAGDVASFAMKVLPMLMVKRGGRIDPHKFDGANPYAFADGGTPDPEIDASDITLNAGPGGYGEGQPFDGPPALAFAGQGAPVSPFAPQSNVGKRVAQPAPAASTAPPDATSPRPARDTGFAGSPWAALTAAGLGMMAGTSPFAGVNIGQGGMQGIKMLEQQRQAGQKDETIDQAARRLDQEADFHTKSLAQTKELHNTATPYQGFEMGKPVAMGQHIDPSTLTPMTTYGVRQPDGSFKPVDLHGVGPDAGGTGTPDGTGSLSGLIDKDALHEMAVSYRKGNTAVMQNLGFGRIGSVNRARLWNEIETGLKADGHGGEDLAAAKANFTAQTAGARTAAVRGANVDMSVQEAQQTFPLALEASAAVPRTDFVPWNKAVQAVQAGTSSPQLARFVTANQAVITAYSQAMSRTGVSTVHSQERAEQLMQTATSQESYQAVLDQMGKEMHAAQLAPEAVRRDIESKITGRAPATTTTSSTPAAAPQVGETRTNAHGVKGRWNGTGWEVVQ